MRLARKTVTLLQNKKLKIAFAESCTGGLLAANITAIPGSSSVFELGVVTYANEFKTAILGVSEKTLSNYGAVSNNTAEEMVKGLKKISSADIAVSVTGIAGPDGGSLEKPVGLVYIGYLFLDKLEIEKNIFSGSRQDIRTSTLEHVFQKVINYLEA